MYTYMDFRYVDCTYNYIQIPIGNNYSGCEAVTDSFLFPTNCLSFKILSNGCNSETKKQKI